MQEERVLKVITLHEGAIALAEVAFRRFQATEEPTFRDEAQRYITLAQERKTWYESQTTKGGTKKSAKVVH